MQTWSRIVDKDLGLDDLPGLAARLAPPPGWRYETRILTETLRVDTTTRDAQVTQDELTNTYSLEFCPTTPQRGPSGALAARLTALPQRGPSGAA